MTTTAYMLMILPSDTLCGSKVTTASSEWSDSPLVPGVDVCSLLEEVLYSGHTIEASCKVEGGGVPPTHVTTINVLRST